MIKLYSLFTFDPGQWLSNGLEKVAGAALQVFRTICYFLDTIIYKLIIDLYNLFETICTSRILSTGDFAELSKRIGFILGIIMLFRVIISFIQMLIDPDIVTDKEKGAVSIIKKCIIVIIMLGVSSFLFDTLHSFQNTVIKNHIISRLLLPKVVDTDNFGAMLSQQVLTSFYILDEDAQGELLYDHCSNYINGLKNQIITEHRFDYGYNCLNETIIKDLNSSDASDSESGSTETQELFVIDFNPISVLVGIALVWLLFRYCISVGVRVIQLTILEIISPMPIISYLSPKKDNMFDKWKNIYISTYIDAFIRIAIINFIVYICANILDYWESGSSEFWESVGSPTDVYTKGFIAVVMILALLTFAKKAPELLKELIPASASKIGFGANMKDVVGLQKGIGTVAGMGTGAAIGLLGGGVFGALGGVLRGGRAGFGAKGVGAAFGAARKAQSEHNLASRQGQLPGIMDRFSTAVGGRTTKEMYDDQVSNLEEAIQNEKVDTAVVRRQSAAYGQISTAKGNIEDRAEKKLFSKSIDATKHAGMADKQRKLLALRAQVESLKNSGANKDVIASAERSYFSKLDETKKDYISYAMNHQDFDAGMTNMFEDLKNTVDINADGAFTGMTLKTDSYDDLESFEKVTTNKNGQLTRDIAVSDAKIQGIENQIQSIKNTQGYRDSHKIK